MIEFKLPDMSCGHCASTVTKTLQRADPACKVTVDLPSHTVHVQATQPREVLAEALTEAGYPPSAPSAPLAPAAPSAPA